ncbi:MAG: hypothetical protein NTX52_15340, partial [Planctomycetota bacterium]|nr:hypothetical protein [Planctomycetota bacterium]
MKRSWMIVMGFGVCSWVIAGQFIQSAQARMPEKLTYLDLVNRLTDLEHLATLPSAGEKCAQWSSYDRASKYDETAGKYVNWGANGDGGWIIRQEDGVSV